MSNAALETPGEICRLGARELAREIAAGRLSAREVMTATLEWIDAINPEVNAIVTLLPERALDAARQADEAQARGGELGPLHGLPIAHKDTNPTRGIRTTFGSRLFSDHVPDHDALIVERLRRAGAIAIGKTNAPEFGAGSQTFNEVFGETRNPWDLAKTCGGSTGGGAVALACRMQALADGSDAGGSLRNPASFCNVVGMRPSPGRVPAWPSQTPWCGLAVDGVMARSTADLAFGLAAVAGPDARAPISIAEAGARFAAPLERDFRGVRVAFSPDLGGLPLDPRVREVIAACSERFRELGCVVEQTEPDFSGADRAFEVLRAWMFEASLGTLLDRGRERMKDTLVWNIEQGRKLSGPDVGAAERARAAYYERVREFMQRHEFLIAPVSQVPPFDIRERWVREIDGEKMGSYIEWMRSCSRISVLGNPAISVPAGFTAEGLPVGVQIVGRHQDDFGVLQLAHAFEELTGYGQQLPPLLSEPG